MFQRGMLALWLILYVTSLIVLADSFSESFETPVPLTPQAELDGGRFWFGSQLAVADGKLMPGNANLEGAKPRKKVSIKPFAIDIDCVTNLQFSQFVRTTGYQTDSEKFQWSFVLESLMLDMGLDDLIAQTDNPEHGLGRVKTSLHWLGVHGANWFHPFGQQVVFPTKPSRRAAEAQAQADGGGGTEAKELKPKYVKKGAKQLARERSEAEAANARLSVDALGLWGHPAVHVSYNDAREYCKWSNTLDQGAEGAADMDVSGAADGGKLLGRRRLPTEREWEFAARGGIHNQSYWWGDGSLFVTGKMNIWESNADYAKHTKSPENVRKAAAAGINSDSDGAEEFPALGSNTRADGFLGVAPARSFPANAYGLHNMLGNVWEWVAGGDDKDVSEAVLCSRCGTVLYCTVL